MEDTHFKAHPLEICNDGCLAWLGRLFGRGLLTMSLPLILAVLVACTPYLERREAALERAEVRAKAGDLDGARRILESFLDYAPRDVPVTLRLARLDLRRGAPRAALHRLEALPSDAERRPAYFELLLEALVECGHFDRAAAMLRVRHEAGGADPELVERLVERTLHLPRPLPDLPLAWRVLRIEKILEEDRLEDAWRLWTELPAHAARRDVLRDRILQRAREEAERHLALGRPEKAKEPLELMLRILPGSAEARRLLAETDGPEATEAGLDAGPVPGLRRLELRLDVGGDG